ncbi:hypothetical protein [Flammeovirga yaeyamensis]|nr:hypothetical protein [Flammeovirga yaeyamensis]MBB3696756.1 hypothetical protein [Flammeovirga yaeyamensis]
MYFKNPSSCQNEYTNLYHGYMDFDVDGMMTFIYQLTPKMATELK